MCALVYVLGDRKKRPLPCSTHLGGPRAKTVNLLVIFCLFFFITERPCSLLATMLFLSLRSKLEFECMSPSLSSHFQLLLTMKVRVQTHIHVHWTTGCVVYMASWLQSTQQRAPHVLFMCSMQPFFSHPHQAPPCTCTDWQAARAPGKSVRAQRHPAPLLLNGLLYVGFRV